MRPHDSGARTACAWARSCCRPPDQCVRTLGTHYTAAGRGPRNCEWRGRGQCWQLPAGARFERGGPSSNNGGKAAVWCVCRSRSPSAAAATRPVAAKGLCTTSTSLMHTGAHSSMLALVEKKGWFVLQRARSARHGRCTPRRRLLRLRGLAVVLGQAHGLLLLLATSVEVPISERKREGSDRHQIRTKSFSH